MSAPARGLHHVEIWVSDLELDSWAWLLEELGFEVVGEWVGGKSWGVDATYLTLTTSPNVSAADHDRRRPGVNHLAFWGGTRSEVDALMAAAPRHGWRRLYDARYPHAGGPDHYAGWVENSAGFKVEIVAERI
ncbi:MAG TPA: VOC family protein [Microbacterium sp.]|nr:VOC family protein [Microbacterium sp.]